MSTEQGPKKRGGRKFLRWFLFILVLALAIFAYFRYYWVFGEGAKAGELNYVVHKGFLFKTYEGKLIQTGLRGQAGSMQSNEFIFSVADTKVAEQLMVNSGAHFNLHYKEYVGALPWRGMSVYIVDSIISMDNQHGEKVLAPR
jgi:hypothetical protein